MTAQLHSVPGQTKRRRKDFLEWKGLDLYSKLSLTCGGNVIIKVLIILFLLVGIANILEIFKIVSKLSFQLNFQVYSLHSQTEEERKAFFGGRKKGDHIMRLRPRALCCHRKWKSLSLCKIWNNRTSPLFFIRPPYK